MDERGNRVFGSGDGEVSGRLAVVAGKAADEQARFERGEVKDAMRRYRPRPVVGMGDVAVGFFALAAIVAFLWWAVAP